jgi:hypothetical protein
MTDIERRIAIRAIIGTFTAEAPTSTSDAMLLAQLLTNHETIVHCHTRSLDGSQPQLQREKDQAHANKAMGVYLKQMELRSRIAVRRRESSSNGEAHSSIIEALKEGNRRVEAMEEQRRNRCENADRDRGVSGGSSDRGIMQASERRSDGERI